MVFLHKFYNKNKAYFKYIIHIQIIGLMIFNIKNIYYVHIIVLIKINY